MEELGGERMSLGFIGLGIMGKPMARNLLKAGHRLCVHSRTARDVDFLVSEGATSAATPREVAEQADVIFTMVPDTPDVQRVVLGENGLIGALAPGKVVIDMSTISAIAVREIAEMVSATGAALLDAPCSGGEKGAIEGKLSIMVGGDAEVFERCRPILEILGARVTHVGGPGSGQVVKSCNQVLAAATVTAMGEALALGTKAGVDPAKIVEVLSAGAARCWALEVRAPYVLKGDFTPGFKAGLQYKDLRLALELSRSIDAPMPIGAIVHEFYKSCMAKGRGDEDHTSVIRVIEEMAGVEIRSENL
jgi:2-hydroxy-3-oxopropionate reductase